jgi:hypothetical protein
VKIAIWRHLDIEKAAIGGGVHTKCWLVEGFTQVIKTEMVRSRKGGKAGFCIPASRTGKAMGRNEGGRDRGKESRRGSLREQVRPCVCLPERTCVRFSEAVSCVTLTGPLPTARTAREGRLQHTYIQKIPISIVALIENTSNIRGRRNMEEKDAKWTNGGRALIDRDPPFSLDTEPRAVTRLGLARDVT